MTKNLKLTPAAADEAFAKADTNGKALLISLYPTHQFLKEITDRIQNFDDVLAVNGIDKTIFESNLTGLSSDEIAYRQVKEIAKAYNQGWVPNWDDSSEYKYVPWFDMRTSSGSGFACSGYGIWHTGAGVGSRLCFQKSAHAKDAGTKFTEIYKEFFTIK
jgi:hypothetical protein